jgi:hypothetical protein
MTAEDNLAIRPSGLRREIDLLLALAVPCWTAASQAAALDLLTQRIPTDWPYFLDQALRQQVASMIGRNLARYLPRDMLLVPHRWIYIAAYQANVRRNGILFGEFGRILYELGQRGLPHAVRKGPSLCTLVYDDPGIRRMNDLDILIERDALEEVAAVLTGLGYAQGVLDATGTRVVPHERRTKLFWAMHLNNSLPFRKPSTDPDVPVFEVDLCLDLFQKQSAGHIDVEEVLARTRPAVVCGEHSTALAPLDQLLDLCLHLYKEATAYLSISRGRDINLSRFLDVVETWRVMPPDDQARFPAFVQEVGAEREVYFALFHASLLYPSAVPSDLLTRLAPQERGYLDEYGSLEGRPRQWKQGFLDRLFNPRRMMELHDASSVPAG